LKYLQWTLPRSPRSRDCSSRSWVRPAKHFAKGNSHEHNTVSEEPGIRAMSAMQDQVFGAPVSDGNAEAILRRAERDDGMELWVAAHEGRIISAGRLEPVADTQFAGIWGGATLEEWRGRGIYRAVTAARARSALKMGKTLIHSDSTAYSRPLLERSGLVRVSTTTPYRWRR
jgi:hypothetical protein